jgi:outer membrane receptor protein involved in Fe transport
MPGLVVTSHSGEGKANQYLMRGYNLDHGTNLATFVDGMPVNEPTHAHGQGYTDLNFMIPELTTNIHYTKGPYFANEGDFASVGSVHISYLDTIQDQASVTVGTLGFERVFTAGSSQAGMGNLLGALQLQHYDGPWVNPDDQRKVNAVLRYSQGNEQDGYSLTGMFCHDLWNSTTDQPERAIAQGLITRFGSLDPSDGGQAQRASLTGQYFATVGDGQFAASAYAFSNHLTLWNDFTHYLVDPDNGDQEAQHEDRAATGAAASYSRMTQLFGFNNDLLTGMQVRYDFIDVSRTPTKDRVPIPAADNPLGARESDQVRLGSNAVYAQATTHWNEWFRSVLAVREDYQSGNDAGTNYGTATSALFEPKASLIFTPQDTTELYLSAGRGFHSDDLRGVNQAKISGVPGAPLIASQTGEEIGMRQTLFGGKVSATLAIFNLDAQSETTYNPDVGQDSAGPASRRIGYEINITYQALRWLEFYASLSQDRARFKTPFYDGTGHIGEYLPNAPFATGSFAGYVKNLGPWSGGLEYRYLGAYPLSSDDEVQGSGYGEWNGDVRYAFTSGWNAALGVYNLLNIKANAMEYWYVDRLAGEPAAGEADVHIHPLEPITVRVTLSKNF